MCAGLSERQTDVGQTRTTARPASLGPRMLYLGSRDHLLHRPACGLQPLSEPSSTQFGCERRLLACWLQSANKEPPRNTQSRFEKAAGFEDTRIHRVTRVAENSGSISRK